MISAKEDDDKTATNKAEMKEGNATTTTITRVRLAQDSLDSAVARYIDDNKPDPLVRKQMKQWVLEWCDEDNEDDDYNGISTTVRETNQKRLLPATHQLSGRLQWKAEYLQITLHTTCCWRGDKEGWLHFAVSASAAPTTATTTTDTVGASSSTAHERMLQRLQQDDYIQKLLRKTSSPLLLCQADIYQAHNELEERVFTDDAAAEAIRRALVWNNKSTNTSNNTSNNNAAVEAVDVLDFVLRYLPLLPLRQHNNNNKSDCTTSTTALANRAQLRLLEDAMYDACEKEEEEELVQGLEISSSSTSHHPGNNNNNKRQRKK